MSVKYHFTRAAAVFAALAATTMLAPSSASAQEEPVTIYGESDFSRTELVSFARLDLTDARDQRRLRHRVGAAVERVCLRDIGRDGLQDRSYYACEDQAWDDAAPQIAKAVSSAANFAMNGGPSLAATAIRVSAR